MRILLIGEYSNLHWTLAQGLRILGHEVIVASTGDRYKNYKREIDLKRKSYNIPDTIKYTYSLIKTFYNFKNFDVVQIINPLFLDLKAEKNLTFYKYLKKHNKKVFLGAFGTDYYWIKACIDKKTFRYSDYYIGNKPTNIQASISCMEEWFKPEKKKLNQEIAHTCDGIIACLYEYYEAYKKDFSDKLMYIPEPINTDEIKFDQRGLQDKVNFFIGIQTMRSQLKGTDRMYKVLKEVHSNYPNESNIKKAESIPYYDYLQLMNESDVILDQLYSYTPSMNALSGMAKGMIAVSGGEPETYDILGEKENKPIVNVLPDEEDIYKKLENIILNKATLPKLSLKSREFVETHHHYIKVAQQYIDFWQS